MSRLSDEARELLLFIENDSQLYERHYIPIVKNLVAKMARGTYDHVKAAKLFMYLTEAGAKKYVQEFGGGTWHQIFSVADRKQAAEDLRDGFETEAKLGNWSKFVPKKYR